MDAIPKVRNEYARIGYKFQCVQEILNAGQNLDPGMIIESVAQRCAPAVDASPDLIE